MAQTTKRGTVNKQFKGDKKSSCRVFAQRDRHSKYAFTWSVTLLWLSGEGQAPSPDPSPRKKLWKFKIIQHKVVMEWVQYSQKIRICAHFAVIIWLNINGCIDAECVQYVPVRTHWIRLDWDSERPSIDKLPNTWGLTHCKVQICIRPSWCHCYSVSLAPVNPDWFYLPGFFLRATAYML